MISMLTVNVYHYKHAKDDVDIIFRSLYETIIHFNGHEIQMIVISFYVNNMRVCINY